MLKDIQEQVCSLSSEGIALGLMWSRHCCFVSQLNLGGKKYIAVLQQKKIKEDAFNQHSFLGGKSEASVAIESWSY